MSSFPESKRDPYQLDLYHPDLPKISTLQWLKFFGIVATEMIRALGREVQKVPDPTRE